ncbi:hypothetical protein HMN09_00615100 [Mycena chlorophos]|uniref:peptidyl-tRNA hydrolase n=1 Tax=Mycena chlorophos TaxID=658473 RepID=A0A8H6T5Q3_MYCCL|nr:hypothetical protein HMN09_00615100 [Mycena chlorophos]
MGRGSSSRPSNDALKHDDDAEPDDGDFAAITAGLLEPCKLVLIVRHDLKMSPETIFDLCGTATLACYRALSNKNPQLVRHWERTGQAKIALKASSEKQMLELQAAAKARNLCARVVGVDGEKNVLAVGPAPVEVVNKLTQTLYHWGSSLPFNWSEGWSGSYMATVLARHFTSNLNSHPNSTLALTGGCLNSLGDIVAQAGQNPTHEWDPARTARFFIFGASISPVLGRWNAFLERRFPFRGAVSKTIFKRVFCDQLIMAPIGLFAFIGSMGVLEGRSRPQIAQKYKDMFVPTLQTNYAVWPALQTINFAFVPLAWRVPFNQTAGIFWNGYLSMVNAREQQKLTREIQLRRTLDA